MDGIISANSIAQELPLTYSLLDLFLEKLKKKVLKKASSYWSFSAALCVGVKVCLSAHTHVCAYACVNKSTTMNRVLKNAKTFRPNIFTLTTGLDLDSSFMFNSNSSCKPSEIRQIRRSPHHIYMCSVIGNNNRYELKKIQKRWRNRQRKLMRLIQMFGSTGLVC